MQHSIALVWKWYHQNQHEQVQQWLNVIHSSEEYMYFVSDGSFDALAQLWLRSPINTWVQLVHQEARYAALNDFPTWPCVPVWVGASFWQRYKVNPDVLLWYPWLVAYALHDTLQEDSFLTSWYIHRAFGDDRMLHQCESQPWTWPAMDQYPTMFGHQLIARIQSESDRNIHYLMNILCPKLWIFHKKNIGGSLTELSKIYRKQLDDEKKDSSELTWNPKWSIQ